MFDIWDKIVKEKEAYYPLIGDTIMFGLSLLLLRNKKYYLIFYLGGFLVNTILNMLVKVFIKEPKVNALKHPLEIAVANGFPVSIEAFGMPSTFYQQYGYNIAYLWFVFQEPYTVAVYLVASIGLLYKFTQHTMLQVGTGFVIGLIVGYLVYILASRYITGNIDGKPEEDAPI